MTDLGPDLETFLEDVLFGLSQPQKELPSKYLYDQRGSQLFDQICQLEEYYVTRTELAIMRSHAEQMISHLGPRALIVEYGSGSSLKTRLLLDAVQNLAGYVPVDISAEHLAESVQNLADSYPELEILPVVADFTEDFEVPTPGQQASHTVVYFPGSTIGNFQPFAAEDWLRRMSNMVGTGGGLLVGVDLEKDPQVLQAAYNDSSGVTAEFNLNLLRRINRELDADFDVSAFEHQGRYVPEASRIEMHLVCQSPQEVTVAGQSFRFEPSESICTEYSHKYTPERFAAMAASAGWGVTGFWTDPEQLFSIQYLTATENPPQ